VSRADAIRAGVALAATLALAGCGLGAGSKPVRVSLLVTQGFGAQTVLANENPKIVGADTVMRMLGGFVESIDKLSGGGDSDWFYYVNGVQAGKGAADTKLHSGDHVWWDRHDWAGTQNIPAVVGSFPEPFVDGYGGKHLPLMIECTQTASKSCRQVEDEFSSFKLVASLSCLLCSQYNESLPVLVGPYATLTPAPAALKLAGPVSASGVYARFEDGGRKLALLNQRGRVVLTAGAGAGLIAATRYRGQPPTWFVTGTDAAGVAAAVQAFNAQTLDDHFAVAVIHDAAIPLPDSEP
jgi:hypothetical protein